MRRSLLFSTVLGLLTVGSSLAVPLTNCSGLPGGGFTCDIFESVPNPGDPLDGIPSEITNVFTLPGAVNWGYVVLLENGLNQDISNWSDVVWFIQNGQTGLATTIQMFSDGCNVQPEGDNSCFQPAFADINGGAPAAFLQQATGGPDDFTNFTTYNSAPNVYNIFSGGATAEGQVPEPATLGMLGAGLIGIAVLARKRAARS